VTGFCCGFGPNSANFSFSIQPYPNRAGQAKADAMHSIALRRSHDRFGKSPHQHYRAIHVVWEFDLGIIRSTSPISFRNPTITTDPNATCVLQRLRIKPSRLAFVLDQPRSIDTAPHFRFVIRSLLFHRKQVMTFHMSIASVRHEENSDHRLRFAIRHDTSDLNQVTIRIIQNTIHP
jgi:hypothetical protein